MAQINESRKVDLEMTIKHKTRCTEKGVLCVETVYYCNVCSVLQVLMGSFSLHHLKKNIIYEKWSPSGCLLYIALFANRKIVIVLRLFCFCIMAIKYFKK